MTIDAAQPDVVKLEAVPNTSVLLPLVIDLDGTLLKTDSLDETFLDTVRENPLDLFKLPVKLLVGRSAVKAFLAGQSGVDVETWPVRQDFLDFVTAQVQAGSRIVLATAADQKIADAIARRFPFISQVVASDGTCNMKGRTKARRLQALFPDGFIYAGDSPADLAVWKVGSGSILVNAAPEVVRKAQRLSTPLAIFPRTPMTLTVLRRSLRLHQWAKNLLVFVPLVLGGRAGDLSAWLVALLGFAALGCAASATYLVNDLWDLPSDRKHWTKKARPLASGAMSIRFGMGLAIAGLVIGFALAGLVGTHALAMLALYTVLTLSYSFGLKRIPILDVFALATLFTLRLGFGIVLTEVRLSPWLLVFSMFVFLSLSMAKRHTEVLRLAERGLAKIRGRGYEASDAPLTLGLGLAAMLGAVLIMVLYLIEDAFPRGQYANPAFLWAIPPILFLFLGRVWLMAQRGLLHDDPVAFALKDRVCLTLGLMTALAVLAALLKVSR